jgi:hypothetical protein
MKFIFVCPEQEKVFETDRFSLIDNRGVREDDEGNRFLDARVRLAEPCPFCGKIHDYAARELACPFGPEEQGG